MSTLYSCKGRFPHVFRRFRLGTVFSTTSLSNSHEHNLETVHVSYVAREKEYDEHGADLLAFRTTTELAAEHKLHELAT
jgi:hypothetical protein